MANAAVSFGAFAMIRSREGGSKRSIFVLNICPSLRWTRTFPLLAV